jgi:hypothetical protein
MGTMNRQQAGRLGALTVLARGTTNTGPARAAMYRKFERQVDPEGLLDPDELEKRVEAARSEYYTRLALKRWAK